MPTTFPKCNPTELLGLLVLLNSHKGSEDVALLADDLDLEIDEIFPALEFAEVLQLVKVTDGRATFTELGKKLVGGSIGDRKAVIRDQLGKTTLFKTLLRALENAPEHSLSDEELGQIVSLSSTPVDEAVMNIVTWGRYSDLFRYDADDHRVILTRRAAGAKAGSGQTRPPASPGNPHGGTGSSSKSSTSPPDPSEIRTSVVATATS